jgi:hypothetical protein
MNVIKHWILICITLNLAVLKKPSQIGSISGPKFHWIPQTFSPILVKCRQVPVPFTTSATTRARHEESSLTIQRQPWHSLGSLLKIHYWIHQFGWTKDSTWGYSIDALAIILVLSFGIHQNMAIVGISRVYRVLNLLAYVDHR